MASFDSGAFDSGAFDTAGGAVLTPARFDNANAFYSATVAPGAVTLTPDRYDNDNAFYSATVTLGGTTLLPARYDNANAFYSATVTPGAVTLTPARYNNANAFYSPTVAKSIYEITPTQANLLYRIYLLHGLQSPLVVDPISRVAGAMEQQVSEAAGVVTVATVSVPSLLGADPGTMIEELAALHGLTDDLVVSATQRTAGSIVQAITQVGNVTTVTRQ